MAATMTTASAMIASLPRIRATADTEMTATDATISVTMCQPESLTFGHDVSTCAREAAPPFVARGNRAVQTVATGVTGEPTAPGRRSGGAVSRKRLRLRARSQSASSLRYQISPR